MSLKLTPREKSQCLISVEKARKLWDKNKLIFVDVRSSANYEVAHIPKSINIQSHLIKTKPFLKDQYTVIVSKGHTLQESLLTCASLRKQGFNNVAALRGGLYTWSQSAPIVGAIKSAKLDQLLPSEFFEAHKERRWFVINTLINSQDVTGLFPGKEIIHYKGNIKEFESTYRKQTSQRSRQKPTFLIVGGEDRHFPELISAINKKQHEGIYYLSSSINSYRAYLVNQQKMLAKLAKGPKRVVRCGG